MLRRGGRARGLRSERGQALILFVGVFTVVLVVGVIVVDFGLWLAERRSVQRAADLAAAAAAQDLLATSNPAADNNAALASASSWAQKNGFSSGVTVRLLCKNTLGGLAPLCTNAPPAGPDACAANQQRYCDAVEVKISKPGAPLFASIFGIGGVNVQAVASAGVTVGPEGNTTQFGGVDQAVVLLDAQGRMGDNCGSNPAECPISNARAAAKNLVAILIGGAGARVAYAPYHNCYGPAAPQGPGIGCVPDELSNPSNISLVLGLSANPTALNNKIDATPHYQLQPANVCLPLWKAKQLLDASPSNGRRVVVLLSDGANRYQHTPTHSTHPPAECHPAATDALPPQTTCAAARTAKGQIDVLTRNMANVLKSMNVEIYVVGLRVCGTPSATVPSAGYCAGIGNGDHDNIADRRLLKCVASSKTGTNDHYIEVSMASALAGVYEDQIAAEIVGRGLIQ